jgi:hypothetical protein
MCEILNSSIAQIFCVLEYLRSGVSAFWDNSSSFCSSLCQELSPELCYNEIDILFKSRSRTIKMTLVFYMDEHIHSAIAVGLRLVRYRCFIPFLCEAA